MSGLEAARDADFAKRQVLFFNVSKGGYAFDEVFMGVPTPGIRRLAKGMDAGLDCMERLCRARENEARLLGWLSLSSAWSRAIDKKLKDALWERAWALRSAMWNWNVVDTAAPVVWGGRFCEGERLDALDSLLGASNHWQRRQGCVACIPLAKKGGADVFLKRAGGLFADNAPLMQRAFGWTLRECVKGNPAVAGPLVIAMGPKLSAAAAAQVSKLKDKDFVADFLDNRRFGC